MTNLRNRDGEIIDSDDEDSIVELLNAASDAGVVVVIGPEGMTKQGILHALEHKGAHSVVYLIDAGHSVPGDASVLN